MDKLKSYYGQANPDILYKIPTNAKVVLEVGCGAGALGKAYKAINPDAIYMGVELNKESAEIAKDNLDFVWNIDAEEKKLDLPESISSIDTLVYGDILQHLRDPQKILIEQSEWLSPDGVVVACIPNAQNWSVILNLLAGKWPQTDDGIFDRSTLRWFTRKSIHDLFSEAGLQVHSIEPRIFNLNQAKAFVKALAPNLGALNLNPNELLKGCAPLKYIITASKKNRRPLLISGLMLKPQVGMNEVRMINPLRNVASQPGVHLVELSHEGISLSNNYGEKTPRIIIWQRQGLTYSDSIPQLKKALQAGYLLISEFDDDPDHFPEIALNRYLDFTAMHGVQVSTEPLAKNIRQHNPEVKVFENCIEELPSENKEKWEQVRQNKPLRVFYGALNREEDWKDWMPQINKLSEIYPKKFEFEIIHDKLFFDCLKSNNKKFTPTCNYLAYKKILSSCHIALIPLKPTKFNSMKSDLKYVEASAHLVASIASPIVYDRNITHNVNGAIAKDADDVFNILSSWAEDPIQARRCAESARAWVRKKRLQKYQSPERISWYFSLWERKNELTKALYQRVPELAEE